MTNETPYFFTTLDDDQMDSVKRQIADQKKTDVVINTYIGPNEREISITVSKETSSFKIEGNKLTVSVVGEAKFQPKKKEQADA